ncbi:diguanylate cyclase [Xanthomonas sp. CFBP 8703]|uniref:diguanylate cyclase n=1 Tax=Xanthomonas bonasiae TaxID=2810351 RepID=A0ABS3B5T0_9XANT|nr:GGDEF domain-containing protein [Xanthomonas bonasiae]MBN6103698.1 diguanylate cyclase [Xanthomonas bonasiae]MBN6113482.1 diguanylate cyclase [Xanthomonas bonasiae]
MPDQRDEPPVGGLRKLLSPRRREPAAPAASAVAPRGHGHARAHGHGAAPAAPGEHADPAAATAALIRLFNHAHQPLELLVAFADGMAGLHGELGDMGRRLQSAAASGDWPSYGRALRQLIDKYIRTIDVGDPLAGPSDPERLRDLLRQAIAGALASLLHNLPELANESEATGEALRQWRPGLPLEPVAQRVRELCHQIALRASDSQEQQTLLLGLFDLLLENVGELLDDTSWLQGQIAVVRDMISGPLDRYSIEEARGSLREVIYKQGLLKQGIAESKEAMKDMMVSFVENLDGMAISTSEFHDRIADYSQTIRDARSIADLNRLLQEVLQDTGHVQQQALRARDHLIAARQEVDAAEQRILRLEQELQDVSGLVRVDQLTGALNRRGLDELFVRELARTERSAQPLCVAMLDLDDFRKLNETYGHPGGDAALRHVVEVARTTLRGSDAIARYGGEEFLLLMPDCTIFEASAAVTRVQRALAQRAVVHEDQRVFVSFSAGVAMRRTGETQDVLVKRADRALYEAKKAGKNRVVSAD